MTDRSLAPATNRAEFRPCAVVPTYDNPRTIANVVRELASHVPHIVVVDDGSAETGARAVAALGDNGRVTVCRRHRNGGKGAAVKTGFRVSRALGFTHALQVDADGQHDLGDVPRLLEAARREPEALILGAPRFDETAPASRRLGREITRWWTHVETGKKVIEDPMCGFRVYPLERALRAGARGDRMDFDIEIAVRMVWDGAIVTNVPTNVRYLGAEDGGVSHFRLVRDNAAISGLHARLCLEGLARRLLRKGRR